MRMNGGGMTGWWGWVLTYNSAGRRYGPAFSAPGPTPGPPAEICSRGRDKETGERQRIEGHDTARAAVKEPARNG